MLNLIDHLPRTSFYSSAVANDPEHAKRLAEMAGKGDGKKWSPPMTSWSPEVDMLAKIFDRLGSLQHAVIAVQVGSQKAGDSPKPHPRPRTAMEDAQQAIRRERHEQLADRMLSRRKKRESLPEPG